MKVVFTLSSRNLVAISPIMDTIGSVQVRANHTYSSAALADSLLIGLAWIH
jgi:hypothetical protein